jgi:naphtho-gamma-pyrone polyketide synthase
LASNSYTIGLCTGSFAAAAISTSQTLSELIPAALEAVLVAFRTGLASIEARNDIEHNAQDPAPLWSVIIGMKEQDALSALKTFIAGKNGLPKVSQPYLSAVTPNNVTLSGPPSVLEEVLASPRFSALKPLKLSVHAPYHASHIYDSSVVETILAGSDANILSSYTPRFPLISCSTGRSVSATNYGSLLRTILHDILIEQLRWDLVLGGCYTEFVQTAPARAQFSLFPVLTNAGMLNVPFRFRNFQRAECAYTQHMLI